MTEYQATLAEDTYTATVADGNYTAGLGSAVVINVVTAEHYAGPYSVTPSENEQTLETGGKHMDGDMVVAPIPSNYGRIAWNGSKLTIY